MALGFLGETVAVILIVVGLLSGVLSVLREVQLMYWPARANRARTFWAFVRIAFAIAAVTLWLNEHSKVATLAARLDFNLAGDLDNIAIAPAGEQSENSVVTVSGTVLNPSGPPTIARNWRMWVEFADGETIQGRPIAMPKVDVSLSTNAKDQPIRVMDKNYFWPRRGADQPIPTGGALPGWIMTLMPVRIDRLKAEFPTISIGFLDVNGREYVISRKFPGTPEVFPTPKDLQQK